MTRGSGVKTISRDLFNKNIYVTTNDIQWPIVENWKQLEVHLKRISMIYTHVPFKTRNLYHLRSRIYFDMKQQSLTKNTSLCMLGSREKSKHAMVTY